MWRHWPTEDDWVGWILNIRGGTTVTGNTAIEAVWLQTEMNGLVLDSRITPIFTEIVDHLAAIIRHPGYKPKGVRQISWE